MSKNIITISEKAIDKVKQLLTARDKPAQAIKVSVKSGGCSGLSYVIEYADEIGKFDEVIEQDNIKIIIDPKAIMYLIGSEMDYIDEKFKSGFIFVNPNEKSRCGCGDSFSV